jgi:hypothetical protein
MQLEHVVGMRGEDRRQQCRHDKSADQQESDQRRPIPREPGEHEPRRAPRPSPMLEASFAVHDVRCRGSTMV